MILKRLLLLSVGLNLLGFVVILHLTGHLRSVPPQPSPAGSEATHPARVRLVAPGLKPSSPPAPATSPVPMDWNQVESEDYTHYISNLRKIGCPEQTVHDIIRADVKDLFEERRRPIYGTNLSIKYWRLDGFEPRLSGEQQQQLAQLQSQKQAVLRSLIGVNEVDFEDFYPSMLNPIAEVKRRYEFLPENKRQELLLQFVQNETPETRQAIEALLTPEELHEYDLRESMLAAKLRAGLSEMDPSEEEFRMIYDRWEKLETAKRLQNSDYGELEAHSQAQIQKVVGAERFNRYVNGIKGWGLLRTP